MFGTTQIKGIKSFASKAAIFSLSICALLFIGGVKAAQAQAITEDFADITTLPAAGWFTQNNSTTVGTTGWFQGNPTVFPAQAGATNSYIGANFNSTTGTNTISNWLLTPNRTFKNGDVVKFWSKSAGTYADRLEVRLSTNGASTNVGTGATAVGDFTTVLLTINQDLTASGYPTTWTEYTITMSGLPAAGASGRVGFRYFVTEGGPSGANSNFIGIDTFSYTPASGPSLAQRAKLDYDGDNKTDFTVVRNTGGGTGGQITWFNNTGAAATSTQWGISTDKFIAGDYDGDHKTDITVWRASENGDSAHSYFYILQSSTNTYRAEQLGSLGDDATIVGDYDGDGKDDVAVYRGGAAAGAQSFWFYRPSATPGVNFRVVQWGQNGDFPAPGDYDGDGKADYAVQRGVSGQGIFLISKSGGGANESVPWGLNTDVICPGDYDGDGKTDFMVIRGVSGGIRWHLLTRAGAQSVVNFGASATDFPTPGDYDGDGKVDVAVWRPSDGTFYVLRSNGGTFQAFKWGQQGDYPVANFNTH